MNIGVIFWQNHLSRSIVFCWHKHPPWIFRIRCSCYTRSIDGTIVYLYLHEWLTLMVNLWVNIPWPTWFLFWYWKTGDFQQCYMFGHEVTSSPFWHGFNVEQMPLKNSGVPGLIWVSIFTHLIFLGLSFPTKSCILDLKMICLSLWFCLLCIRHPPKV